MSSRYGHRMAAEATLIHSGHFTGNGFRSILTGVLYHPADISLDSEMAADLIRADDPLWDGYMDDVEIKSEVDIWIDTDQYGITIDGVDVTGKLDDIQTNYLIDQCVEDSYNV